MKLDRREMVILLLWGMGVYYVVAGVWPLVHMRSFLFVTGPKIDLWLVQTVGVLILVSGLVFLLAASRRRPSDEVLLLAVGDALALAAIEIVHVADGTLRAIYLAEAFVEIVLAALLAVLWLPVRGSTPSGGGNVERTYGEKLR